MPAFSHGVPRPEKGHPDHHVPCRFFGPCNGVMEDEPVKDGHKGYDSHGSHEGCHKDEGCPVKHFEKSLQQFHFSTSPSVRKGDRAVVRPSPAHLQILENALYSGGYFSMPAILASAAATASRASFTHCSPAWDFT
ncbi:hypothetical protein SDC9_134899 [bioreactor metagenome]|uniref:Uncharacterized protein n=1 Tax=bioreactor metagenome TaxID=1076179 RepID=A0A645DEV7_9ZZZZ